MESFQRAANPADLHFSVLAAANLSAVLHTLRMSLLVTTDNQPYLLSIGPGDAHDVHVHGLLQAGRATLSRAQTKLALCYGNTVQLFQFRLSKGTNPKAAQIMVLPQLDMTIPGAQIVCGAWHQQTLHLLEQRTQSLLIVRDTYVEQGRYFHSTNQERDENVELSGVLLDESGPRLLTGWVDRAEVGEETPSSVSRQGFVIDIQGNRSVSGDLAQPLRPVVHGGRLWVIDELAGTLSVVSPDFSLVVPTLRFSRPITAVAFHQQFAFVALGRPENSDSSDGLGFCSPTIAVVNTVSGELVSSLELVLGVESIVDIVALPGVLSAGLVGDTVISASPGQ